MNRGKLVILFIFGLSAIMGGYAWWHHFTQGRRCVEFWGAETGELIRYAPQVEVLRLEHGNDGANEAIQIQGSPYAVVAGKDITAVQGLVHARQALIEDASFQWNEQAAGPANWQFVMRFTDDGQHVEVAFACDQGLVRLVGTDRQAVLQPHLAEAYQTRLPKWLGSEANSSPTNQPAAADTQ